MSSLLDTCLDLSKNLQSIRLAYLTSLSLVFAFAGTGSAQVVRDEAFLIDESRAPFVYEAKAEAPSAPEELAGFVSSDYRNATDEFQQRALFAKFKPVIDRRISEAKSAKLFVVKFGYPLPKYDFDKQGFSTQVGESFFVYFNRSGYVVRFTNWDQLDFIPIEESRAKSLQPMLRSNRQATLRVYGTLKECREEPVNGSDKKIIYLQATKAVLSVGSENKFAGERIISADADDNVHSTSPSGDGSLNQGAVTLGSSDHQDVKDDPRYAPLDAKLNEVYAKLRARLSPARRDQLKQFESDFINRRDRLRDNPDSFFALTEQQIGALQQMLDFAP